MKEKNGHIHATDLLNKYPEMPFIDRQKLTGIANTMPTRPDRIRPGTLLPHILAGALLPVHREIGRKTLKEPGDPMLEEFLLASENLRKKESRHLGFIPLPTMRYSLHIRRTILGFHGDIWAGYLTFSVDQPTADVTILQIAVLPEFREKYVATEMIRTLYNETSVMILGDVKFRMRQDMEYQARFWRKLNYKRTGKIDTTPNRDKVPVEYWQLSDFPLDEE